MDDCIFCKIVAKKISSKVVQEDDLLIAIHDVNPQAPTHILIIPKRHIAQVSESAEEDNLLFGTMIGFARGIAHQLHLDKGYRLVLNNGRGAGQTVFHIHLHLLGGRAMSWPPG